MSFIELAKNDIQENLFLKITQSVTWQVCLKGTKPHTINLKKSCIYELTPIPVYQYMNMNKLLYLGYLGHWL